MVVILPNDPNVVFKYFSQLFGESNADEEVSPDTADPEAAAEAGKDALSTESNTEVSFSNH